MRHVLYIRVELAQEYGEDLLDLVKKYGKW
jgi:hypothetical protein